MRVRSQGFRTVDVLLTPHRWHADIKPDNILFVQQRVKLADVGFARMQVKAKATIEERAKIRGGTSTFGELKDLASQCQQLMIPGAPECHSGRNTDVPLSQSIDIWSLGCVLSYAATFVVLGYDGFNPFYHLRKRAIEKFMAANPGTNLKDDDAFHNGQDVLPEVSQWHQFLRQRLSQADRTTALVLDLVDEHMLLCDSPDKPRISSQNLVHKCSRILEQSRASQQAEISPAIQQVLEDLKNTVQDPSAPNNKQVLTNSEWQTSTQEVKRLKAQEQRLIYLKNGLTKSSAASRSRNPPIQVIVNSENGNRSSTYMSSAAGPSTANPRSSMGNISLVPSTDHSDPSRSNSPSNPPAGAHRPQSGYGNLPVPWNMSSPRTKKAFTWWQKSPEDFLKEQYRRRDIVSSLSPLWHDQADCLPGICHGQFLDYVSTLGRS